MSSVQTVRLFVCLSLSDVGEPGAHRLEILETDCTDIFALRSPKATHLLPMEHGIWGNLGETIEVRWAGKSGVLEHKSGNISLNF